MTSMAERPAEVATRTVPGHWEGDLIKGTRNGSAVGTLVEWTTRLVILAKMNGTDARSARAGLTKTLRHVPALLRKTLAYDRGKERAEHAPWAQRLAIQLTLCCGWRRLVFGPGAMPARPSMSISRCTRLRLIWCPTPSRHYRILRLP